MDTKLPNAAASSPLRGSQPSDGEARSMASLLELAERCEAATGPDRVLDAEIMVALNGYVMHEDSNPLSGIFAFWDRGICHNCSSWADPTASLDAAMTLVPEGWAWAGGRQHDGRGTMAAVSQDEAVIPAIAAAPALALCAAALRARAAQ